MKHHWAFWMIVGGLAIDIVDAFTAPAGQTGGVFYGSTGFLKTVNASIPGHLNTGEVIAAIGAGLMFAQGGTK